MTSRALLIEVRLLDGRYHGVGDWPPAPFRVFQALVAGAYGGRWRSESEAEKDAAFRWLETLPPPHVAAPPKIDAGATVYFVPNNDIDSVGGDPRRVSEIRAGKSVRAAIFEADGPCLYAWPFETGEEHASRLCKLAERLHTLGRGIDAAFARAVVADWSAAEAQLARHGGAIGRPCAAGDARNAACPVGGSLDSLKKRYEAGSLRFEARSEGRAMVTLFRQPPKAKFHAVAYDRPSTRLLFDLRPSDDARPFRSVGLDRVAELTKSTRDLAMRRLAGAFPGRAAEIERLVVGAHAEPSDVTRRARIIPLPSIGSIYADSSIRRLLVEIPPDCPIAHVEMAWALSGQNLPGVEEVAADTGEVLAETILVPGADESMLGHYGIGRRSSRRWQTITPVALPEQRPRGRMGGRARAQVDQHAAVAVVDALRHSGKDWRNVRIRVQMEPFHRRGVRADAFHPNRFAGRLRHVEILFPEPVAGPLVIGDGRWLGLGLMAPVADAAPALHLFAIDPGEAPATIERERLVQAFRRAVMACADSALRTAGTRHNDPLPTFFTGHMPDGATARTGRHEHLFFLADDADGDGRVDRLAVISPHLADRGVALDREKMREIDKHLPLLDRALAGLTLLRAGRAGAPRLTRVSEAGDDDRIFGRAKCWISSSRYLPTRHPHSGNVETAVAADLLAECHRRGLPRPEVDVLDVDVGPRGGVTARARLRFMAAVEGPIMLGRRSHFGAGLFRAEM
jgi:CRISPR-associated protein Csb2